MTSTFVKELESSEEHYQTIVEDYQTIEKNYHKIEDYFSNVIPHIHQYPQYSGYSIDCSHVVSKLNESQTYENLANIFSYLCRKYERFVMCVCDECHKCKKSNLYTKEYLDHTIQLVMDHDIDVLKFLYKYVENTIEYINILDKNLSFYTIDTIFWFLDICDKKNIDFTNFIKNLLSTSHQTNQNIVQILQRYNAQVYKNGNIIFNIVSSFDMYYMGGQRCNNLTFLPVIKWFHKLICQLRHNISMYCKYSNGKYKYINSSENEINKTLEDICIEKNSSITTIIMRHTDVDHGFLIVF